MCISSEFQIPFEVAVAANGLKRCCFGSLAGGEGRMTRPYISFIDIHKSLPST